MTARVTTDELVQNAASSSPGADLTPRGATAGVRSRPAQPVLEETESFAAAARALVGNVLGALYSDDKLPVGEDLRSATERFAVGLADPAAAVDFVGRLRQALLRRHRDDAAADDDRTRLDAVIDQVLSSVVEVSFNELRDQALTDPLTGLGNRRALVRDLEVEVARAARTGAPLTVVVLDVDRLKQVNDSEGHEAGDDALRTVGLALEHIARESDRAYRHGGDEFALLLSDSLVADASSIEDRLRRTGAPRCSVGIANSLTDPIDELLLVADRRLYVDRRARRPEA